MNSIVSVCGTPKEQELWSLDRADNTVTHRNGLKLEIRDGVVVDIKHIPNGLKTIDIDKFSREAECVWMTPRKKNKPVVIIKKRRRIAPQ